MKDILLDENFSLWALYHNTSDALMEVRSKEMENFGLTHIEHRLLLAIPLINNTTGKKVTASDLSRWLCRKQSSISELLTRMEKKGLVKRESHPSNKKVRIIQLTDKGKKLKEKGYKEGMPIVNKSISSLSEEEQHQLWVIAGKLRRAAFKEMDLPDRWPFPHFK